VILTQVGDDLRTQVAVIGSGPGGAVVAATLAAAGKEVLLIEEGPYLEQDSCTQFSYTEMKQKYRAGGLTASFGRPNIAYAEGSCVGGGSEVNSGLYHRIPEQLLREWAGEYEVENLSATDMGPYFEEIEKVMQPQTYPGKVPVASALLRRGAGKLGWASADVPRLVTFNDENDLQGLPGSRRRPMTQTYIPRFLDGGGRLLPDSRVRRLQRAGTAWQIHTTFRGHQPFIVQADHVFVCAGAIHTPALLRRSGLNRNIGQSLSLQPMVKVTATFNEQVNWPDMGIGAEQVKEFSPRYSFGCSISAPAHLAINLLPHGGGTRQVLDDGRHMISYYVMSRGSPSGKVRILPGFSDPVVSYQMSQEEMANLAAGTSGLTRLMLEAGATMVFTGIAEAPVARDAADLAAMPAMLGPESANVMTVHLMASCPMGENRHRTAVNSWGRVHGQAGLYIADASMLCASPGVNPQGGIMAIARRNCDHFLAGHTP